LFFGISLSSWIKIRLQFVFAQIQVFGYSQPDFPASLKDAFSAGVRRERTLVRSTESREVGQDPLTINRLKSFAVGLSTGSEEIFYLFR
jgi:hypothetical protein